jgi:hypothetical protein
MSSMRWNLNELLHAWERWRDVRSGTRLLHAVVVVFNRRGVDCSIRVASSRQYFVASASVAVQFGNRESSESGIPVGV